jgi:hypothetical protein
MYCPKCDQYFVRNEDGCPTCGFAKGFYAPVAPVEEPEETKNEGVKENEG